MSSPDDEAQIEAFIRAKGVTRCPTACVAPTNASGGSVDRAELRQRAERLEALREEKARQVWLRTTVAVWNRPVQSIARHASP